MKTYSEEDIRKKVFNKTNGAVSYYQGFKAVSKKATFKCNLCGKVWDTLPSNAYKLRNGCSECSMKHRREEVQNKEPLFLRRMEEKFPNKFTYLGGFKTYKTPVHLKCNDCGSFIDVTPSTLFQHKYGCDRCSHEVRKKEKEKLQDLYLLYNGEISLVGEYKGVAVKNKFHCNKCGREWDALINNVLNGYGCNHGNGRKSRKTVEEFKENLYLIHGGRISYLHGYTTTKKPVTLKCNICGKVWDTRAKNVIKGKHGCPRCSRSRGELLIEDWLNCNLGDESYTPNKTFCGLVGTGGGRLSYDFYVPSKNLCIEFQGEQHYKPTMFKGVEDADKKFKKQIEHDKRKRDYCKENNIGLLEIKYTDIDNIDKILFDFIIK